MIPRFVYFDLDNTLVDHDGALQVALRQLCGRQPGWLARRSFEEIHTEFDAINGELWAEYGAGRITSEILRRERSRRLADFCEPGRSDTDVDRITEEYVELYIASTRPVDGALATVEQLSSRCALGIISNGFAQWQRRKLMIAGIDRYFESVVLSEEIGSMKPDRAIFDAAARFAGCPAEQIIVVGDSYPIDVLGAANAGMRSIWFNPRRLQLPHSRDFPLPDAVITSLPELLSLISPDQSE